MFTSEHKIIDIAFDSVKAKLSNSPKPENYLGLHYEFIDNRQIIKTDYFIGVCWLETNIEPLVVEPKIENLDYLEMFMSCFKHSEISKYLNKTYKIYFEEPLIELPTNKFELTPLLIIHFLQVVKSIVKKGLKKGYVNVNQNLTSKIKGKILTNKTIKENHLNFKYNKTFCNYQVFTIDCEENRILKNALLFVEKFLAKNKIDNRLLQILNFNLSFFENIGNEIDIQKIKHIKVNSFFHEYKEGLQLALMILKRFSYSPQTTQKELDKNIPPFYINMPLLFELFAFGKLKEIFKVDNIVYQYSANSEIPDFLNLTRQEVLDAKYKSKYQSNEYELEDIRQLSGYARDEKINSVLNNSINNVIDCFIVYPTITSDKKFSDINYKSDKINGFTKFYKIGIKIPIKDDKNVANIL